MASDYLLEIDGIKGESQDDKHKETIEIHSFSWGGTNSGSFSSGGGGGTGKVSMGDVHFVTHVSKASPKLAEAMCTGKHITKVTLTVRKAGGKQEEFYKVILNGALVSSYQSGGSAASGEFPTDQFSLNFSEIEFNYCPQNEQGGLGGQVPFKYNVKGNKNG